MKINPNTGEVVGLLPCGHDAQELNLHKGLPFCSLCFLRATDEDKDKGYKWAVFLCNLHPKFIFPYLETDKPTMWGWCRNQPKQPPEGGHELVWKFVTVEMKCELKSL